MTFNHAADRCARPFCPFGAVASGVERGGIPADRRDVALRGGSVVASAAHY